MCIIANLKRINLFLSGLNPNIYLYFAVGEFFLERIALIIN